MTVFHTLTAPLDGLNLIEASAGTGKTWTIAALFTRLVLEQALRPEQILVVTYTKAATAELRGRIRQRLAQTAEAFEAGHSDDAFCQDLLAGTPAAVHDDAARRLRAAVSGFDAAAVFTIHGFCQRALGEHALAAGQELDREFLADEASLLQTVVDEAWKAETRSATPGWLAWLLANRQSPDSWLAALRPYLSHGALRIALPAQPDVATLENRFQHAFAEAASRWATEGEAAVAWLQARSEAGEFKGSHRKDWLAGSLLLWQQWLAGPALPNLTEDDKAPGQAESKVRRLYERELREALKQASPVPAVFGLFEPLANAALPLQQAYTARLAATQGRLIGELTLRLAEHKATLGVMSFHDLLVALDDALAAAGGDALASALQSRYQAALIDEFQDTDPLQFRIFDRLFGNSGTPAFLVGDPKQAIYAFRGAELHAYLAAHDKVDPTRRYSLATNRRSTPQLVAAIGEVFGQSPHPFLLAELSYPPVGALDDKPALLLDGQPQAAMQWQWLGDEGLGKGEARQRAVAMAADQIAALLAPGKAQLGERPLQGGDIAVLASAHAELQAMQAALTERGIPSVRISRQSVFDTDEARDLLQILTALLAPTERAVRAAMSTVSMGLDAATLYVCLHDEAAWDATLADFRRWQAALQSRGPMAALNAWLIESGAAERIAGWRDGERRLTNLLHLFELLELERRERVGLAPLLAWYRTSLADAASGEDEARLMRLESDASRVRLVTIHAAKGLEYPVVFCPFLWDGQLFRQQEVWALCHEDGGNVLDLGSDQYSRRRSAARQEKLAEKLRLLYVALTRPKTACFITWGEVKDMASAALAWLLAGGQELPRSAAQLHIELTRLIDGAGPQCMAWATSPPSVAEQAAPSLLPAPEPVVAQLSRRLYWQWRMSSFSGLTAGVHEETPDHDVLTSEPTLLIDEELPVSRFDNFPAGPRAGVCLHALFERWDFNRRDRAGLETLASRQLEAHGFDPAWRHVAADMVEAALHTPLTPSGACLADVPANQRLVELEFTYALQPFAWAELARLLAEPAFGLPGAFAEAASSLHAEVGSGYLKGFIDLSCALDGRHYILDWKSNRLGDYRPAAIVAAMASEHYYLQALIYCVALHRYLKWRLADYDYHQQFGGALYLFLRGLPGEGVWQYRPPLALIEALEHLLCGQTEPA